MGRILVKATRYNQAVPCDNICMPEFPAIIIEAAFLWPCGRSCLFITAVFFVGRYQLIGIVFIIVNLGCFKTNLVNTDFVAELFTSSIWCSLGFTTRNWKKIKGVLLFSCFSI